jgi:hypothetical protein
MVSKRTSLPQNSVYGFKCFAMWNYAMWVTLPVFHNSSPTTFIAETVSEIHVGIFFIPISVRRFDYPNVLR